MILKKHNIKLSWTGCRKIFIHSALSHKFNLKVLGIEKLLIYAFGSKPKQYIFWNSAKVNFRGIYDREKFIDSEGLETTCLSEAIIQSLSKEMDILLKQKTNN